LDGRVRSAAAIELEEEEESKIGARSGSKLDPSKAKRGRDLRGRNKKGGSDTNKADLVRNRIRRELNS